MVNEIDAFFISKKQEEARQYLQKKLKNKRLPNTELNAYLSHINGLSNEQEVVNYINKVNKEMGEEKKKEKTVKEKKAHKSFITDFYEKGPNLDVSKKAKNRQDKITSMFTSDGVIKSTPFQKKEKEKKKKEYTKPWMSLKDTKSKREISKLQAKGKKGQLTLDDYARERSGVEVAAAKGHNIIANIVNKLQKPKEFAKAIPGAVWNATKVGTKYAAKGIKVGIQKGATLAAKGAVGLAKGTVKAGALALNYGPQVINTIGMINGYKREWNRQLRKRAKKDQKTIHKLKGADRTQEIAEQWGSYKMKERPSANKLEQIFYDAQRMYKDYTERITKSNEEYLKKQRERNPLSSGPQKVNEFGAPVNELSIVTLERPGIITKNIEEKRNRYVSREAKQRVLIDQQRGFQLSKKNNEALVNDILKNPDKNFAEAEELVKRIPKEYIDEVNRETASVISHPEELKVEDAKTKEHMENVRLLLNFTTGTLTDIAHMANGSGILQKGMDSIRALMDKGKAKQEDYDDVNFYTAMVNKKQKEYDAFRERQEEDEKAVAMNKDNMKKVVENPTEAEKYLRKEPSKFNPVIASDEQIKQEAELNTPLYAKKAEYLNIIKTAEKELKALDKKDADGKSWWEKIGDKIKTKISRSDFEEQIYKAKRELNAIAKESGDKTLPYPEAYTLMDKTKDAAGRVVGAIPGVAKDVAKKTGEIAGATVNLAGQVVGGVGKVAGSLVAEGVKGIADGVTGQENIVDKTAQELKDKYGNSVKDMMTGVGQTVKNLAELIKVQAAGLDDKAKADLMYANGEMFEEQFRDTKGDIMELSREDYLKNMRNNENVRKLLETLDKKDVNVMKDMGVDVRMKNEYVKGKAMQLAHRAFLRKDKEALAQLHSYGINSAEELQLREQDLANYCALKGEDLSNARAMLDDYALLTPKQYKQKVLDPINQAQREKGIDVATGFIGKAMEVKDLLSDIKENHQKVYEANLEKFITREGVHEKANINRVRDMIKEKYMKNQKEVDNEKFTQSKIRNKGLAMLTGIMYSTGFASRDTEMKVLEAAKPLLFDNGKFILSDKYLSTEAGVKKATNRLRNFGLFREHYFNTHGIVATQDTFDEIGTGNTPTSIAMPTQGQKYEDAEDIVNRTVVLGAFEGKGGPLIDYEKNKRIGIVREMLNENRQNVSIIMRQIENPHLLSLRELEDINKQAASTNKEQELRNIGSRINEIVEKRRKDYYGDTTGEMAPIQVRNDEGDPSVEEGTYANKKTREHFMNVFMDEDDKDHDDLLKLTKDDFRDNQVVYKDGKFLFVDTDALGNKIYSYKKDTDQWRRLINHLNNFDVRQHAQTSRNTDWTANNYNHMYENSIPSNAEELVKNVRDNESKFFDRRVYNAEAKKEFDQSLGEMWKLNEEQIARKTAELKTSTFEISTGVVFDKKEQKEQKAKLSIRNKKSFHRQLAARPVKNVLTSPVKDESNTLENVQTSPVKDESNTLEDVQTSPQPKPKLYMEQDTDTISISPDTKEKANLVATAMIPLLTESAANVRQLVYNLTPNKQARKENGTVFSTPKPSKRMEIKTTTPVELKGFPKPQLATSEAQEAHVSPKIYNFKLHNPLTVDIKEEPKAALATSIIQEAHVSPIKTILTPQHITQVEIRGNKYGSMIKRQKTMYDQATSPPKTDNTKEIQQAVLEIKEKQIDNVAKIKKAPLRMKYEGRHDIFNFITENVGAKAIGKNVGGDIIFENIDDARQFVRQAYPGQIDDYEQIDKRLITEMINGSKKYIANEKKNQLLKNDLEAIGVESAAAMREDTKAQMIKKGLPGYSPIREELLHKGQPSSPQTPVRELQSYNEQRIARQSTEPQEQTTSEIATGNIIATPIRTNDNNVEEQSSPQ